MARKEKKILLFLVEGKAELVSLESILTTFFSTDDVRVEIMHCDITVPDASGEQEILNIIGEKIKYFCSIQKVTKKDIKAVIQIADTDGAFVPESCVVQQTQGKKLEYSESEIFAPNIRAIKHRNKVKSLNLRKLSSTGKVSNINYHIYYLSRNLEHVFHNKSENLTKEEKIDLSNSFDDMYGNNIEAFLSFIASEDFAVHGDYSETWNYIRLNTNSLKRKSNLHLLFNQ